MILYLITNTITGKQYVGQTFQTLSDRWSQHVYDAKNRRFESRLGGAIRKYGRDAFCVSILDTATSREELNKKEKEFIIAYQTSNRFLGYNIAEGGYEGHVGPMPREAVLKMAATKIGNKNCVGRVMSTETRNKISLALKEKWSREPSPNKGRIFSPEHRKKLGDARRRLAKEKHQPKIPSSLK